MVASGVNPWRSGGGQISGFRISSYGRWHYGPMGSTVKLVPHLFLGLAGAS